MYEHLTHPRFHRHSGKINVFYRRGWLFRKQMIINVGRLNFPEDWWLSFERLSWNLVVFPRIQQGQVSVCEGKKKGECKNRGKSKNRDAAFSILFASECPPFYVRIG